MRNNELAVDNFIKEALLMKDFDHPNVLSLIGVVMSNEQVPMVITPYMAKGDLKHVLRDVNEVGDLLDNITFYLLYRLIVLLNST